MKFDIGTTVSMKMTVFLNVTPCNSVRIYRRFLGNFVNFYNDTQRHSPG
jgi:hypothetical protein